MANIKTHLNNIKNATFGKEVRGSIHDGIDAINKEVESTTGKQVDLESTFDQLVINAGNSNAEIVDARVKADGTSYTKLGDRLDSFDSQLEHNVNEIDFIKYNTTSEPLIFYVEINGNKDNDGLSKDTAFNKISTALRKIPRNIFNDVVIKVGEGVFEENDMLDEWGRKVGLNIDGLNIHCDRTNTDVVLDNITFQENKKRAKLFIKGSGIDKTIIEGDGVSRVGIKSRLRDVYIEDITVKGYKTGLTTHEGGAISGYNIKVENFTSQAVLVESQQSKIEIGNLQIENTLGANYIIHGINGQINISSSNITNISNSYMFYLENCFLELSNNTLSKGNSYLGILSRNSNINIDNCTFDGLENRFFSGDIGINNSIFKNIETSAILNRNSHLLIRNSNMFNNNICVEQFGGYLACQNLKSLDNDVQKYNNIGLLLHKGYCNISPYSITNLGVDLKGEQDKPYTDYVIKSDYIKMPSVNYDKSVFSSSGYTAQNLTISIRNLKNISIGTSNTPNTLYFALRKVTNPSSYHVKDAYEQLIKTVNALVDYGIFASNTWFLLDNVTNNEECFKNVQLKFNKLVEKLENLGLIECNGDIY